jgi:hypothetical protein
MTLSKDYLNQIFEYRDRELYWKVDRGSNKVKNMLVGSADVYGYLETSISKKSYKVHRLIFMMHHGYLPKIVDHIDGNKLNNNIKNLRPANHNQNNQNSKKPITNTSGAKGVYWCKNVKKWRVCIRANGKHRHIGLFKDLELADLVAKEARDKYHGEFARHQ